MDWKKPSAVAASGRKPLRSVVRRKSCVPPEGRKILSAIPRLSGIASDLFAASKVVNPRPAPLEKRIKVGYEAPRGDGN